MHFNFKDHFPKKPAFLHQAQGKILNYTVKKILICPAALAGSDRYSSTRCPHRKAEKSFLMQTKDVIKCKTKNLMHFNFKEKYQEMLYQAQGKILNYTVKKLLICPAALAGSDRYSSTRCPHRKRQGERQAHAQADHKVLFKIFF